LCWADLLRVLLPGVVVGALLGLVVAKRPYHLKRIHPKSWTRKARLMEKKEWAKLVTISLIVALVSLFISLKIGEALYVAGIEVYSPEEFPLVRLQEHPILMLLVVTLLPILEEWIFRGIVMDEVRRWSGSVVLAIVVSSLSFAAFHLTNPGTYLAYVIPILPCGVLLCLCYLKVGLGGAILAHSAYNTFLFLLSV